MASTASSNRRLKRLLLLLPVLLVIAVAVNAKTLLQLARGERTLKSVVYGVQHTMETTLARMPPPKDIGAKDAKVVVEVFFFGGDPCHVNTIFTGQALGEVDPKRILVKFVSGSGPLGNSRAQELKLGCMQGMAVNGKTKFTVPGPRITGVPALMGHGGPQTPMKGALAPGQKPDPAQAKVKNHVVYLTAETHWTVKDLHWILNDELKRAYKGKGLGMTAEQLETKIAEATKRIRQKAEEEAKRGGLKLSPQPSGGDRPPTETPAPSASTGK